MAKSILPVAAMEKLLKKAGASRVSEDAKESLREILEEYADKIGKKAVEFSRHSGRVTVKGTDVKLASK
ncbi:histone family protein [Candidatus Woesearchaeota archaeon]|nr:histone family protein [Candidatus Woesearchaeota archaeon]